ncbi:ferredoxin [Actinorhabdospora filicis]|uniref:Ferredoxin n=1 Tax=Actinorhabdospora filicis TaxID=1785913 RepID=A0A9W6SSG5_9ACTN|nr:FAD-dependent oxidoreductase [Actinorhabdospora filicis]GLZ82075.1 ferredoxin [Actinorhabdospora filicis]
MALTSEDTVLIVGAGLAGTRAAETLRAEGFGGRVVLIGGETHRPYDRPPLSKAYLNGAPADEVYLHDEGWYAEQGIELLLGRPATSLRRADHTVELADGAHLRYDRLLLATGASARRLPLPGDVHYLRDFGDSTALRETLIKGGRIVLVGGGWIGLEVAAAARGYGCDVTVIEPQPTPLYGVLGAEIGAHFADAHRAHGVDFRLGASVSAFDVDGNRVTAVLTDSGDRVEADAVVVGVGAVPNTALAAEAGLSVDNGIVVGEDFRTDDPHVYAVGDAASQYRSFYGRHVRVEHWANALDGGPAAARSILGLPAGFDPVPFFYSDQYDLGMEYAGWFPPGGWDTLVTRGDVPGNAFYAFWLSDGEVVAGMHVNMWDEGIAPVQKLIRERRRVDPEELADPGKAL